MRLKVFSVFLFVNSPTFSNNFRYCFFCDCCFGYSLFFTYGFKGAKSVLACCLLELNNFCVLYIFKEFKSGCKFVITSICYLNSVIGVASLTNERSDFLKSYKLSFVMSAVNIRRSLCPISLDSLNLVRMWSRELRLLCEIGYIINGSLFI